MPSVSQRLVLFWLIFLQKFCKSGMGGYIKTYETEEFENINLDDEKMEADASHPDFLITRLSRALENFSCLKRNSTIAEGSPCKRNMSSLSTKSWKKMNFFRLMWRRVVAKRKKLNESSSIPKFAIIKTEELEQLLNVCCDIMEYFENNRGDGDIEIKKHWSMKKKMEEKNQSMKKQIEVTVIKEEMCTTWDQVERNNDLDGQDIVENPIDCANVILTKQDEIRFEKPAILRSVSATAAGDSAIPFAKETVNDECLLLLSTNQMFHPNFESDSRPDSNSPHEDQVSSQEVNLSDEKTEQEVNEDEENKILNFHEFPSNLRGSKKGICKFYPCCDRLCHVTDLTVSDDSFDSKSLQLGTDKDPVSYRIPLYDSGNDPSIFVDCPSLNLMAPNIVPYSSESSASAVSSSSSVCSTTLQLTVGNHATECDIRKDINVQCKGDEIDASVTKTSSNSIFKGYFQFFAQYVFDHIYRPLIRRFH